MGAGGGWGSVPLGTSGRVLEHASELSLQEAGGEGLGCLSLYFHWSGRRLFQALRAQQVPVAGDAVSQVLRNAQDGEFLKGHGGQRQPLLQMCS